MLTLATFLLLLLAGGATVVAASLTRPRATLPVALGALALTALLWLPALGQLPLSYMAPLPADFPWSWQVGQLQWLLSLALFLLQLGALLHLTARTTTGQQPRQVRQVVLLGAVAHFAFWSSSLPALVTGWSLLVLFWGLGRRESAGARRQHNVAPGRAMSGLAAIFLLWFAAASTPYAAPDGGPATWSTLSTSLALLAVVVQLSLAPLALRQTLSGVEGSRLSSLLPLLLTSAAGAALLLRLEAVRDVSLGFALPLTVAGLVGLLLAGRLAWSGGEDQERLAPALVMAQASFILLSGVWASPQAVAAETRVLLLGGGLLALAGAAHLPLVAVAPLAALLGLPLTAGFQGRTALYGAWAADSRWLLIAVTALLHLPLAAAALRAVRHSLPVTPARPQLERSQLPSVAGLLLPTVGLLGVAGLPDAGLVAWATVLAPLALAWPLLRFLPETAEVERTMRQAFQLPLPSGAGALVRRATRGAGLALREAALILEGESGLLWLLLFLVILWLA